MMVVVLEGFSFKKIGRAFPSYFNVRAEPIADELPSEDFPV